MAAITAPALRLPTPVAARHCAVRFGRLDLAPFQQPDRIDQDVPSAGL